MKHILIVYHSSGIEGPIDYYIRYLSHKKYRLETIIHPLDKYEGRESIVSLGNKRKKQYMRKTRGSINLLIDMGISIRWILSQPIDTYIGANNFDTYTGILCRKVFRKKIGKLIYFASDFSEDRFSSGILNRLYMHIERSALKHADLVISNTRRSEKKRLELGLKKERSIVVPNGVELKNPTFTNKNIDKTNFIFEGSVTHEHGLYELINTLAPLMKHLTIIGQGDDIERVEKLCKKKKIPYTLKHRIPHDAVMDILASFEGIGLAPYNNESKWTYYCSPLKVFEYVSSGIPVIVSDIPEVAEVIEKNGYGIAYHDMNLKEIKEKLDNFDTKFFYKKSKIFYNTYSQSTLYKRLDKYI